MLSATLKQLHNKPPTTSVMAEEINCCVNTVKQVYCRKRNLHSSQITDKTKTRNDPLFMGKYKECQLWFYIRCPSVRLLSSVRVQVEVFHQACLPGNFYISMQQLVWTIVDNKLQCSFPFIAQKCMFKWLTNKKLAKTVCNYDLCRCGCSLTTSMLVQNS